jgi:hypothetical protein
MFDVFPGLNQGTAGFVVALIAEPSTIAITTIRGEHCEDIAWAFATRFERGVRGHIV